MPILCYVLALQGDAYVWGTACNTVCGAVHGVRPVGSVVLPQHTRPTPKDSFPMPHTPSAQALPTLHTFDRGNGPELWATPLPPDNARLVSYSELQSMDCWLKHHYAYHLRLKPVDTYVGLRLGRAWDAWYNEWHMGTGEPPTTPMLPGPVPVLPDPDLHLDTWDTLYNAVPDPELHTRLEAAQHHAEWELMVEARRADADLLDRKLDRPADWEDQLRDMRTTVLAMGLQYAARWGGGDGLHTVGVQVHFAVPMPSANGQGRSNKYYLHGVIDRVAVAPDGQVWLVDAKLRMGYIETDYRDQFSHDPQLALYGWAMREAGWPVVGGFIDASAAVVPRWPQVKDTLETVYTDELDEKGKPIPLQEPVLDDDGEPVLFKSGARKGQPKMVNVKRPGLYSGWEDHTVLPVALAALDAHGIPTSQYTAELQHLEHEWSDQIDSRFSWQMERVPYTDAELARATLSCRAVTAHLDHLPPVPMPSKMKCKWCSFNTLCPSTNPVDAADGFTTPEDRAAMRARREQEVAAAQADPF